MKDKKLGMIIREYRNNLGLKVYELAKTVGVNPVYITKIEKHNDLPSIVVYMNIEKALNLPSTLRVQYFKEKYPEASHGPSPINFERMANSLEGGSPLGILQDFTAHKFDNPPETRPFIIRIIQSYNTKKNLTEKEIKELTTILKKIIRYNRLMMEEKIHFLKKAHDITKEDIPA